MKSIKKMKKMPKLTGVVPLLYDREVIASICNVSNAQANAIDYLYDVICELEAEIRQLKEQHRNGICMEK